MNEFSAVATFFKEGGVVMYFMLMIAVVVVAISVERFIVISRAGGLDSRKLVEAIVQSVQKGDLGGARRHSQVSNAPAARVAEAVLRVAGSDEARLQATADDAATLALAPLSRRIQHLNVMANVATLLGLLGTIYGLITAFSAVGAADPSQRSAFMAAGISTALNATAFGLMIAIPTLLIQGYLVGRVERIAEQVDEMSIRLSQVLSRDSGDETSLLRPAHAHRAAMPATLVAPVSGVARQMGGR